jgi:protein-disulfide isomerase
MADSRKARRNERAERARAARIEAERAERAAERRRRRVRVAVIAVLALALVGALIGVSQVGGASQSSPPADLFRGVHQSGVVLGDPKASYTLTEFGDPQCPFCAQFDRDVLPRVVSDYVRPGTLRIEFMPLAFIGPDSKRAARMALAVGEQGRFWDFLDLVYRNQGVENSGYIDDSFLRSLADQIPGIDTQRALDRRDTQAVDTELARARERAREFGISSTPSFLLARTGRPPQPLAIRSLDPDAFSAALASRIGGAGR